MRKNLVLLMMMFFGMSYLIAATGKISGRVVDTDGNPVFGANIVVDGTANGAASGVDGSYIILNVRPGKKTVVCTHVSYHTVTVKDVKVNIDLTTSLDFELTSNVMEMDEVVIVAKEESVKIDVTGGDTSVDIGKVTDLTGSTDVTSILSTEKGIKEGANGELHIRGGRAGEVGVTIDGISVGDPTQKNQSTEINFSNVESFDIQKGVPNAEYGNALSGTMNIVYKIGSQKETHGHASYATDFFFGDSKLDYHRGEFSVSGPIPIPGLEFKPTYYIGTDLTMKHGNARAYREGGRKDGDFYDFGSFDLTGLGFDMPQKRENYFSFIFKTSYDFSRETSVRLSFTKSRERNFGHGLPNKDGLKTFYDYSYRYTPQTTTQDLTDITILNFSMKHSLTPLSFLDFYFSYYNREFEHTDAGVKPDKVKFLDEEDFFSTAEVGGYDFNGNGLRDGLDTEGFVDKPNEEGQINGTFDREWFEGWDQGYANYEDAVAANGDNPVDFIDANGNGKYDGDYLYDSNNNGYWDVWETGMAYLGFKSGTFTTVGGQTIVIPEQTGNNGEILEGVVVEGFDDTDLSGHYEESKILNPNGGAEAYIDGDRFYDTGEPFIDQYRWTENPFATDSTDAYVYVRNGIRDEGLKVKVPLTFFDPSSTSNKDSVLVYPAEEYADLASTYGSETQTNPRVNLAYDPYGNGEFDEFEAYCHYRTRGVNSLGDEGWVVGHTPKGLKDMDGNFVTVDPTDYVEFKGTYVIYKAPIQAYNDPKNLQEMDYDSNYMTWIDYNKNGKFETSNGKYDAGEVYDDWNHSGKWNKNPGFLMPGHHGGAPYSLQDNSIYKFKLNYTNQLNKNHLMKTGLEFVYNDFDYYTVYGYWNHYDTDNYPVFDNDPYPTRGSEKTVYQYNPVEFSYFLQDKMEFEDLVLNVGVRVDGRIHDQKAEDYYNEQVEADVLGYEEKFDKTQIEISPRFGVSHAITESSKLFFTYGHLYQKPVYTQVYAPNTSIGNNVLFGNMNLGYERNVQYELGVVAEYEIFGENLLFDVAAYYKDIYDMVNLRTYEESGKTASIDYNSDYGKTRGVELSIDRSLKDHYQWGISYSFGYAYGKSSSSTSNFAAAQDPDIEVSVKEFPLLWDERHQLSVFLSYGYGEDDRFMDIPYMDNWNISATTDFGSGTPFTPNVEYYNYKKATKDIEPYSERKPWTSNTDLRLSKTFALGSGTKDYGDLRFSFDIFNLFNKTNVLRVYSSTGEWDNPGKKALEDNDELKEMYRSPNRIKEKRHYRFTVSYKW